MSDHTPEPWGLAEVGDKQKFLCPAKDNLSILTVALEYRDEEDDPDYFGAVWNPADARRIVAAVNYCAGIPTETLERGRTPNEAVEALKTVQKLVMFSEFPLCRQVLEVIDAAGVIP